MNHIKANSVTKNFFAMNLRARFMKQALVAAVIFTAALMGGNAQAATDTWVGSAGSTNWNQATWTGGNATPATGDSLVFTSANASASTTLTNTLATSTNFGSITFNAGALAYTMTGNNFNLTSASPTTAATPRRLARPAASISPARRKLSP